MKPSALNDRRTTSRALGTAFLLVPVTLMLLSSGVFLAGGTLGAWMFPAAVIAGLASLMWQPRRVLPASLFLIFIATAVAAMAWLHDISTDGSLYHNEITVLLMQGWNPVYESAPGSPYLWTPHYPKLMETMQACVALTLDNLEAGKAINLILMASAACYGRMYLRSFASTRASVFIIAAGLCNPVLVTQILTTYVDFTIYLYLIIALILIAELTAYPSSRGYRLLLLAVILLALGTKYNIGFYCLLAIATWVAWLLWQRKWRMAWQGVILGAVALLLGAVLFAHPYVTNTVTHGHPLFPIFGPGGEGLSGIVLDNVYHHHNRFVNFLISMGLPYTSPYLAWVDCGSTIGGFSLLMPVILAVTVYALIAERRRWPGAVILVIIASVAGCFLFIASWSARYNAFLWIAPLTALTALYRYDVRRAMRRWLGGLMIGALVFCAPFIAMCVRQTIKIDSYAEMLRGTEVVIERPVKADLVYMLRRHGIPYTTALSISRDRSVALGGVMYSVEVPQALYDSMMCRFRPWTDWFRAGEATPQASGATSAPEAD